MPAFFCVLNSESVRRSTISAALRTCSASHANKSVCSEAPRVALSWKHARRPFSWPAAALKCRRTASRSLWMSARPCLLMAKPCAVANEYVSALWHVPPQTTTCCSKAEQRACSGRSRSQSNKALSSSLQWAKSSVGVDAGWNLWPERSEGLSRHECRCGLELATGAFGESFTAVVA